MKENRIRTTFSLSPLLDRNLEAFCVKTEKQKSQVIREALEQYLTAHGVDPDKELFIEWT